MDNILKVIDVVQPTLGNQKSMVRITLADLLSASHPDYFTRYKVKIGEINCKAPPR